MKKQKSILFSLLILLFCCSKLNAQTGYDEGTTWHYGLIREVNHVYTGYLPQVLTINGNAVINEQYFQRIIKSEDGFPFEYIKKENDKVYWFYQQNGDISILYDFAAGQGESWTISINDCELPT